MPETVVELNPEGRGARSARADRRKAENQSAGHGQILVCDPRLRPSRLRGRLAVCSAGNSFPCPQPQLDLLQRAIRATVFIVIVLAIAKAVSVYAIGRISDASTRFTLRRILHLVAGILIVLIGLSIFFANWYTALDLRRRRLGHRRAFRPDADDEFHRLDLHPGAPALSRGRSDQNRRRHRRRDRRQLHRHHALGIWRLLPFDRSSQRPRHQIPEREGARRDRLQLFVAAFPLRLERDQISDRLPERFEIRGETMERIVEEEIGEDMEERVTVYRELLAKTPVNELEVRAHPRVFFRVDEVTWIDAIVRYVVPPREAGSGENPADPKTARRP